MAEEAGIRRIFHEGEKEVIITADDEILFFTFLLKLQKNLVISGVEFLTKIG